jgi:hypothetical protein
MDDAGNNINKEEAEQPGTAADSAGRSVQTQLQ